MDEIIVNGKKYYSTKQNFEGDVRIVILQRGWVMIGRFSRKDDICKLQNAQVIRRWGSNKGLGQLAKDGPQSETILDPCNGIVEFHYLTMIASISVDETKWALI